MRITRHIHYLDTPKVCIRQEFNFDPPFDMPSTLGKVDELYPGVAFGLPGRTSTAKKTSPVVNPNGLLHIREVVKAGEVISVLLRPNYRIKNLVIPENSTLQLLAAEFGIIYWITFGGTGAVEITGQLVKDDDGIYGKLKANLTDTAMRAYLAQSALANPPVAIERAETPPGLMTRVEAAAYLRISLRTLQRRVEEGLIVPARGNKYRRAELEYYLDSAKGKRKRR